MVSINLNPYQHRLEIVMRSTKLVLIDLRLFFSIIILIYLMYLRTACFFQVDGDFYKSGNFGAQMHVLPNLLSCYQLIHLRAQWEESDRTLKR